MEAIMEIVSFALRVLAPLVAIIIVCICFSSLRYGRREEHALIALTDDINDVVYPVLFWENALGRGRGSDIKLNDPSVSRDHAVLLRREAGWFITDTGSKYGVTVNGEKVEGRRQVYIGDQIVLGNTHLTLRKADVVQDERILRKEIRKRSKIASPSSIMMLLTLFMVLLIAEAYINTNNSDVLLPSLLFIGLMWVFFLVSRKFLHRATFELETLALMLTGIGIMLSVTHDIRQAWVQMIAAFGGMILFSFLIAFMEVPDRVQKWRLIISIGAVLFLGLNLLIGQVQNGAQNWIYIGSISIQPSEFVKVAYIFVGASTLDILQTKKNLFEFIAFTALCIGALFLMSDFGTACIFFVTFLLISFMRSGDIKTIILAVTAAILGVMIILYFKPYIADRFEAWGHVWDYAQTSGFQQVNTLIYSASGGLFGVGLSLGCLQYIFASESDLVFGLISEEMGFLIALAVVIVIGGFAVYARGITTKSRSTFYSITACTAAGLLVIQAALNIFGATDILPLTGVTLPFISEGGSSMVACWGLLAFIKAADERTYSNRRRKRHKRTEETEDYVEI
ncbi:MAG: FtsW/RodA/SpoVE family cell cycle protein [Acutalibacteraceae bacterium]